MHEERFERRAGPLRRVVPEAVAQFLDCGRLENGFARLRCTACGGEHLLAFSCRTRNFCPSCQAKRAALFAERLCDEIALPVPHRHVTFTVPKTLRGLFERDRRLLGLLARCAYEALRRCYQAHLRREDAAPGVVASIQTFGSYANFHPHVHALVTDGAVTGEGTFLPLLTPDLEAVCEVFRRLVLAGLRRAERLSAAFHERLLAWSPSGCMPESPGAFAPGAEGGHVPLRVAARRCAPRRGSRSMGRRSRTRTSPSAWSGWRGT